MAKPFFDLERIDPDGLRRIGGLLRNAGYTEKGIRERLGLDDIAGLSLASYPHYLKNRLRRRSPLDLAIRLFLLQEAVPAEQLDPVIDLEGRKQLRAAGVLKADGASQTYRAMASLYPVEEKLFFTDHRFAHTGWLKARVPRSPVMYLGADSYYLTRSTVRKPIRSALDLCTGSGVHAILAAGSAERAVGVDVSPRAVNFARLNAMLNDSWNAVFVEGDLYSPVGGERFDLILANPPFVPSPVYELAYRDGGPSGADVLRRIVAALPDFLTGDGMAQIVTHVAERDGEPYMERIRRWLGGANFHMHSLRLGEEDIVDYAIAHTKRTFGESYTRHTAQLNEWVTNLRSQRFKRVLAVVLTFQWNGEAPSPPWTQEDECKPPHEPINSELARLLAAKKRVRSMSDLSTLDAIRVSVPDDLTLIERRRPTGMGFETKGFRVELKNAHLSPELDIKPLVRDLLERVDNRSTIPQVIARLAEDTGQSVSDLNDRCRRAFLIMFERGLVTFDELAGAPKVAAAKPVKAPIAAAKVPKVPKAKVEDPFLNSSEDHGAPADAIGNGNGAGHTVEESVEAEEKADG